MLCPLTVYAVEERGGGGGGGGGVVVKLIAPRHVSFELHLKLCKSDCFETPYGRCNTGNISANRIAGLSAAAG